MNERRASAAMERLPWLEDEPKSSNRMDGHGLKRWAPAIAGAAVLIAAGSYWLGRETAPHDMADRPAVVTELGKGEATMNLPEAQKAVEDVVATAPVPSTDAEVAAPKPVPPPLVRHGRIDIRSKPKVVAAPKADNKEEFWPATDSSGAAGRMVRIGTFVDRASAIKGRKAVMAIYPGMNKIPTTVVAVPSARDGVTYYRLQMGTTSQAHSEVLCQRMRIIGQSCVVVGLGKTSQ